MTPMRTPSVHAVRKPDLALPSAQLVERGVDVVGHRLGRVWVDDDDAISHGTHSGGGIAPVRSVIRP